MRSSAQLMFEDITHLGGVEWFNHAAPSVFHRCWAQSEGWHGFMQVQRCACGGMRTNITHEWRDRNQRSGWLLQWLSNVWVR